MNGILPLLLGIVVLLVGGIAMTRSAGGNASSRRQLDARLLELQVRSDLVTREAAPALSREMPEWVGIMLARADITPRIEPLLIAGAVVVGVAGIVFLLFGWIAALAVVVMAVAGGFIALRVVADRRVSRFVEDLPFFLDTVRQMLTTGNSVQQALTRATENSGENMQRYLLPMIRRMQHGAAVGDSATWLAERLNILELHMFATAIQTNVRYGGRLSLVLANLVGVLRDRSRVIRELKAATAETRTSGIVLAALPIVAGIFIMFSNPAYLHFFTATTRGNHMLLLAIALQLAGMAIMRRLMRLDY